MDEARLASIAEALAGVAPRRAVERLLEVSVELLPIAAASVAVVGNAQHLGALAAAGPLASVVDDLQFTLGEGPCVAVDRSHRLILEPDLACSATMWPAFAPAAVHAGVAAAFAFPLQIGTVALGVLALYHHQSGDLGPGDLADAIAIARIATHLLLELERDLPPGFLPDRMADVVDHRANVHQATGMIAAQIGADVAAALGRLRAYSWSEDRPVGDVADDVIARRLRFEAS